MDEYLRLTPAPATPASGAVSERMQALLSRAVEEQVNEQRQVQSLLSEVRNALAQVQRDGRSEPAGQADLGAHLAHHASESRAQLAQLDERLEAIVRAVGTSAQVLQGISGQLERLGDSVREQAANAGRTEPTAQVRREVSELRSRVDAVEGAVRGDVAALHQRLVADNERLTDAAAESTRTIANHVDNAVLVLAEALLRRPGITGDTSSPELIAEPVADLVAEQVAEPSAGEVTLAPPADDAPLEVPDVPQTSQASGAPDVAEASDLPDVAEASDVRDVPEASDVPDVPEASDVPPAVENEPAAANVFGKVPADDPLWGSSFRTPVLPMREEPDPLPAFASPAVGSEASDDSDDAGGLVDGERSEPLPSWATPVLGLPSAGVATPYDDPVGDLPVAGEPNSGFSLPAAAPYDLERALFGDRSRSSGEFAPVPPVESESSAGATDGDGADDAAADDSSANGDEPADRPHPANHADAQDPEDTEDAPRRRPWWRPST